MPITRPDSGIGPSEAMWKKCSASEFGWSDGGVNAIQCVITLPQGAGYFLLMLNHGQMGPSTRTMKRMRYWSNKKNSADIDVNESLNASQFHASGADNCCVTFDTLSLKMDSLESGYHLTEKSKDLDIDLKIIPVVPAVRLGSGKTTVDSGFTQRAVMPRCSVEGRMSVKGTMIDLNGAIADLYKQKSNLKPSDLGSSMRVIRAHGARTSVYSIEESLEKVGGGYLTETYGIADGNFVEVTSTPVTTEQIASQVVEHTKKVSYRSQHPVKTDKIQLDFATTDAGVTLVGATDILSQMPFLVRKAMSIIVGSPWSFEFYKENAQVKVGDVGETVAASVFMRCS